MKRSYHSSIPPSGTAGPPQASQYGAPTYHAPPLLHQASPHPAGQPPPPPPPTQTQGSNLYPQYPPPYGASPVPATGLQQQQVAQHPQYPGYGYGGQAVQPAAPAPAPAPAAPQDAATAAYAAQYAAYYAAYAQAAQAQVAPPSSASPFPGAPAQPQSAGGHYPAHAPPAPQQYQHAQQHQQANPLASSQGAPPYKRTRYDQPPLPQSAQPPLPPGPPPPMPPSVLPPVGGRGPPPSRHATDRGAHYPPGGSSSRGPPPMNSPRDYDYPGDHRYGGPRAGSPGPPRGSGVSGRGPRMGGNAPSMGNSLPAGPRGARVALTSYASSRDDRSSGGGGRGGSQRSGPSNASGSSRPLSGLPGSHKYSGSPRGPGSGSVVSVPNAPKGPKSLANSVTPSTSAPRRNERKWGTSSSGETKRPSGRDVEREREKDRDRDGEGGKRTLTDFRIEGLEIEELEWSWKKVEEREGDAKKALQETVEEEQREQESQDERQAAEISEPSDENKDLTLPDPSPDSELKVEGAETLDEEEGRLGQTQVPENSNGDHSIQDDESPAMPGEDESKAAATTDDSAVDGTPTSAQAPPAPGIPAKGKHARPEDDSATEDSANEDKKERQERETKAKKVKVEEDVAQTGDATPTPSGEALDSDAIVDGEKKALAEPSVPSDATESSKNGVPQLVHPLPSKPVMIPTGPKAANHSHPAARSSVKKAESTVPIPAPASSRENSRLRIYFSSPIPTLSSSAQPLSGSLPQNRKDTSKTKRGGNEGSASTRPSGKKPDDSQLAKPSDPIEEEEATAETQPQEEDEETHDIDGQAVDDDRDVDGEDFDGEELDGSMIEDEQTKDNPDEVAEGRDGGDSEVTSKSGAEEQPEGSEDEKTRSSGVRDTGETVDTPLSEPLLDAPLPVPPPEPTADRISISYARNTRRMVIDAEVVETVKIFRSLGKIEVVVSCQPSIVRVGESEVEDEYRICKGILVEALDPEADDYIVMDRASLEDAWRQSERSEAETAPSSVVEEPLLPPLHHFLTRPSPNEQPTLSIIPSTSFTRPSFTIVAQLDRANPLTEARWVKTGEVENWILSLGIANGQDPKDPKQLSKWLGKITVADPDQAPTIQHALDSWTTSSNIGSLDDRREFVKTHMSNIDNVVEILLRLSRGDRTGPSHHSASSHAQPSTVGALAHQLSAPFPTQQTQVSLAVLAMFRLTVKTAEKAGIDQAEIEKQVSEIVRSVPHHLQFKALDGMFKEVYKPRGGKAGSGRMNRGGGNSRRE